MGQLEKWSGSGRIWRPGSSGSGRIWQVWERSGRQPESWPGSGRSGDLGAQDLAGSGRSGRGLARVRQDLARSSARSSWELRIWPGSGQDLAGLARSGRPGQGSPGGLEARNLGNQRISRFSRKRLQNRSWADFQPGGPLGTPGQGPLALAVLLRPLIKEKSCDLSAQGPGSKFKRGVVLPSIWSVFCTFYPPMLRSGIL